MPLSSGTRLGPYEIVAPVGAGGMGEVYKARDTRLERSVAVKVLPEHLSSSTEIRQRFEREARTISQLSHPHICALYDVGREGEIEYLVMEYLEGKTLSARLGGGALPLDQSLRYGTQIADALDKAHRQGIVHRDLKPGNVMLTSSGVKLLDFGLAKVIAPGGSPQLTSLPTQSSPVTEAGTILGTFQYMAPEQLEAKDADARTDIFALGAVLYEMATGRTAFSGTSQASLISSIMTSEPAAISAVQPMSPPALDRIVRTCLAKDPENRWHDAGDVAKQLQAVAEGLTAGAAVAADAGPRRRSRERVLWLGAIVLLAAAALAALRLRPHAELAPVRFEVPPPAGGSLASTGWLSPDGRSVAFTAPDPSGAARVWIRPLDTVEARPLEGTGAVSDLPSLAWSPDGRSLALAAGQKIKTIAITGGTAQPVCDTQVTFGLTWGSSGVLLFVPFYGSGLVQVPAGGGTPSPATSVDRGAGEVAHLWPHFLPDGRRFLFFSRTKQGRESHQGWITSGSLDAKAVHRIRAADAFSGVAQGRLVFIIAGTTYSQAFDSSTLSVRGEPAVISGRALIDGSIVNSNVDVAGANLTFRSDPDKLRRLVILDREGRKLSEVGTPQTYVQDIALSPDGRLALVVQRNSQRGQNEVHLVDLERGTSARTGSGIEEENAAIWSPDGERFLLDWDREGPYDMVLRRADGSGAQETLPRSDFDKVPEDWSRDGRLILFRNYDPKEQGLEILRVGSKDSPVHMPGTEAASGFRLSPDGHWILWTSSETGRREVYVQRFPDGSARQQVSVNGGGSARWNPDGHEILFVSPDARLMAATVATAGSALRISIPKALFPLSRAQMEDAYIGAQASAWDVFPDGKRFLVLLPVSETDPSSITVVLNWTSQLPR